MLTPAIAVAPQAPFGNLIQTFNDLNLDIAKTDGELERLQSQRTVPGAGWSEWFAHTAEGLQGARDAFMTVRPGDADLIARLGYEVRDLAESGGRVAIMRSQNSAFGAGWGEMLDSTIQTVRDASNALLNSPVPGRPDHGGPTDPMPPAPRPQVPTTRLTADVNRAVDLIRESMSTIQTVPVNDRGDESTKQARLAAYHVNRAAQDLLEQHFTTETDAVSRVLRAADVSLTDAAWQLAKKPSDDGRFNGVNIPGALRSSSAAIDMLQELTGHPATPSPATGDDAPTSGAGNGSTSSGDETVMGREQGAASSAGIANHDDIPVGDVDYCTTPGFPRI
jgi:hypothetical protein